MHTFVTPLFGKAKIKLAQTPRAVAPFGGLASFIGFLDEIGYAQQLRAHLPWQLISPNAIPSTGQAEFKELPDEMIKASNELPERNQPAKQDDLASHLNRAVRESSFGSGQSVVKNERHD